MSLYEEEHEGLALPEWLIKLPLREVKKRVYDDSLRAALQSNFASKGRLASIQCRKEEHFQLNNLSRLVLILEFKGLDSERSDKKEVVLQYQFEADHEDDGATRSWVYPNDPSLPHLPTFVRVPSFLKEVQWDEPCDPAISSERSCSAQKLLYNPSRRATFLISLPKTEKKFILKMVQPSDFDEFSNKVNAIRKSSLSRHIILPQLVSYSRSAGIFLYDYIPGIQVKKLRKEEFLKVKSFLFNEVVQVLSEIHQTLLPALPVWDPHTNEIDRLHRLLGQLNRHYCDVQKRGAEAIKPMVDQLITFMEQQTRTYTQMIHRTFSEKHLVYHLDSNGTQKLGILDWDSSCSGPKERDIGQFLSGFTEQFEDFRRFLDLYESRSGTSIDRNATNHFLVYRCLVKLLHKGLKRNDLDQSYLDNINNLSRQLCDNQLIG